MTIEVWLGIAVPLGVVSLLMCLLAIVTAREARRP